MDIDRETIRDRSTEAVFERGENYRDEGRIQRLDRFDDLVTAGDLLSTLIELWTPKSTDIVLTYDLAMTDIDQYKTYREVGTQLNSDITDAYSDRELIVETAEELGIEFDERNIAYEFEAQMPAHFEFALYEYRRDGTTAAKRYLEAERWGDDVEREILEATIDADPSLFEVTSVSGSGPRITVTDLLNDREHTLVDVNFSRTAEPGVVLFFRPVRYDEFTTTSGVSFPFPDEEKGQLLAEYNRRIDPDASRAVSRQRFVAFHDLYRDHGIYTQYR